MAQDFQDWLQWAAQHPGWVLLFGCLLGFVEALALIGIFIPGILLLFMLGAVVGWDPGLLAGLSAAVAVGAMLGDGLSYWLGLRYSSRIHSWGLLRRNPHWLGAGEDFFLRHGGRSVFIARFLGPLRPVVPLVAGSLGMRPAAFVPRMVIACLLWAPLMLLPGALFGESLELAAEFGGRLTLLLLVVVAGLWLIAWTTRVVYEWGARRTPWWIKNLARWLRRHPRLGRWFGGLVEPGRREVTAVIALGLMLVISLAALTAALLLAPLSTEAWEAGFRFSGLAASLRNHFADPILLVVWLAGSVPVLVGLVGLTALALAALRQWTALGHWLLCTVGGALLALLLNTLTGWVLGRPSMPGSVAEVPNVLFVLVTLVFGYAALLLAREFRPRRRKWLYLGVAVWLGLFGFAEFYFAIATLNGLIAALALAGGWLALTGIGYRSRAVALPGAGWLLFAFVGAWLIGTVLAVQQLHAPMSDRFRLDRSVTPMAMSDWWSGDWSRLPMQRSRIGPIERVVFDAQLAATEARLLEDLAAVGFLPPPVTGWARLRPLIAVRPDRNRVGHFGRDFAGQPQQVMLRRILPDGGVVLLRGWDSGLRLRPGGIPVWLVQVRELEAVRRLGFLNTWRERDAGRERALERLQRELQWQWREPEIEAPLLGRSLDSIGAALGAEQANQSVQTLVRIADGQQGLGLGRVQRQH